MGSWADLSGRRGEEGKKLSWDVPWAPGVSLQKRRVSSEGSGPSSCPLLGTLHFQELAVTTACHLACRRESSPHFVLPGSHGGM